MDGSHLRPAALRARASVGAESVERLIDRAVDIVQLQRKPAVDRAGTTEHFDVGIHKIGLALVGSVTQVERSRIESIGPLSECLDRSSPHSLFPCAHEAEHRQPPSNCSTRLPRQRCGGRSQFGVLVERLHQFIVARQRSTIAGKFDARPTDIRESRAGRGSPASPSRSTDEWHFVGYRLRGASR